MDLVMVSTFLLVGASWDAFFSAVGAKFGAGAGVGIALHNFIGGSGGLVFAAALLLLPRLRIDAMKNGLSYGLVAGAITIPLGCIPLAIWLNEPILEVVAFSLLPHLVWGMTLGWTVYYALLRAGAAKKTVPSY